MRYPSIRIQRPVYTYSPLTCIAGYWIPWIQQYCDTTVCAYSLKGGIRPCIHGYRCIHAPPGMPHLRATRLDVTNSGAQACKDKKVRITNPGVPSATYLMVVRGAQSLRLSMLARFCEPAQSSHRRCSQRPLNHADAQRFLAPSPKAQSPTTNPALSSTRGTRETRQENPPGPHPSSRFWY